MASTSKNVVDQIINELLTEVRTSTFNDVFCEFLLEMRILSLKQSIMTQE